MENLARSVHFITLHILYVCLVLTQASYSISYVMRKPASCICDNKGADQLCSNYASDQSFCFFRYIDITIPLLPKSEISSC